MNLLYISVALTCIYFGCYLAICLKQSISILLAFLFTKMNTWKYYLFFYQKSCCILHIKDFPIQCVKHTITLCKQAEETSCGSETLKNFDMMAGHGNYFSFSYKHEMNTSKFDNFYQLHKENKRVLFYRC